MSDTHTGRNVMVSPLPTAVVADALDEMGLPVACLGWDIVPVDPDHHLVGRAFPVLQEVVDTPAEQPYAGLLAALDEIEAGEVFVIPSARSERAAVWGELVSTACSYRGVAGAVTDGLIRDTRAVRALGFPVFSRGSIPLDTNARLEIVGGAEAVVIDDVAISRGDLIVADADGVVVVPDEHAQRVLLAANQKLRRESRFRQAVANGLPASEAFRRFGVL